MHSRGRKESTVQVDDADESESSYNFLLKTESILNTFNKIFGRLFSCPVPSTEDEYYETIRSSRKSFKLNEPAAFNEDLTQRRPFVHAKAILLPPTINNKTPETKKKFVFKEDEEEELFYVLHTDSESEEIVRVFTSESDGKQEIMKLYMDNEPPKRIVRNKDSIWRIMFPLKTRRNVDKRTHFTGDGCKLHDPCIIGRVMLPELASKDTNTKKIRKKERSDKECQCSMDGTVIKRGRRKRLKLPKEFF